MISIILPAYNCESTLDRCVESVLSQQFKAFELLLVDDGSTDRTAAICDAYAAKDSRVRVFHKSNGGVSSARNIGLENAKGEWITFGDSDDEFVENAFQIIEEATSGQDSERPSLIFENIMIDPHDERPAYVLYKHGIDTVNELFNQRLWGAVWNKTFSRRIIEDNRIRFDESVHLSEDCLFVAEYCSYVPDRVVFVEYPCYIQHMPESYREKYRKYISFSNELSLYNKIKSVNRICSTTLVDGLVMSLLCEVRGPRGLGEKVSALKNEVGKDIRHAKGFRKFGIRLLTHSDSVSIWHMVFSVYYLLKCY